MVHIRSFARHFFIQHFPRPLRYRTDNFAPLTKRRQIHLSVCLCDSDKTGREMTDSHTHTSSLFIVLQAVKTHLGKASAVRFASTACLQKYNCHRSVSHTFSHTHCSLGRGLGHINVHSICLTLTDTIKSVLMCEKIPDSVTA